MLFPPRVTHTNIASTSIRSTTHLSNRFNLATRRAFSSSRATRKSTMYNNKTFTSTSNTPNGEVSPSTTFHYQQSGNIVWASYSGGSIVRGSLIAKVLNDKGELDMRYHHINKDGELMTGQCQSTPELLEDGRIRLHERWKWTSGDGSEGESVVEELKTG